MNNDLISRSELKKAIKNLYNETLDGIVKFGIEKAYKEIDNAPTVEAVEFEYHSKLIKQAYQKGKDIRPQGEWEYTQYDGNPNIGNWHCSNCHNICYEMKLAHNNYNFCPNCGADMRGDENEQ